ncbi:MAG TPA: dihydrodipicolinate reductase [Mycobacteriales bacterium]|nr:dihydrodipicolinate reductase [Mycobacteriales bacterium]
MAYRVIQWATGAQGVESIRAVIDREDLELVGGWVHSADKDGADLGTLAGRDPIGVFATRDLDALLALDADCVAYMPRNTSLDQVCALLASGKNVVTTAFLFYPRALPPTDLDRLLAACEQGGTSIHGTGLNPGNLSGVLPLALSGMSRTIERITLQERADWTFYESTHITFDNMRFGRPAAEVNEHDSEFLRFNSGIFKEEIALIADSLGAGIDEITTKVELVLAEQDHEIFGITLAAGTVSGQRWHWEGKRAGRTLVDIETLWTVGGEYPAHWPTPQDGWTLTIEGDPSMRAHFLSLASWTRNLPMAEHVRAASVATAMQAVNAIPAVCAAPPGIATMADLPLVRSGVGFGYAPVGVTP